MKTVFKVGDKVYDARYGWGVIERADNGCDLPYPILVNFKKGHSSYTLEGKAAIVDLIPLLSLTEYTLQGFSQERPEVLPERGQIVWVRDSSNSNWHCTQFMHKDDTGYVVTSKNPFDNKNGIHYNLLTTENPYSNK
jgi:hypothetical protein